MLKGIIVATFPYSEADLILRIITRDLGKVSAIAKHVRKSKARFSGSLDLFDRGVFSLSKGRGSLSVVSSFSREPSFQELRNNLTRFALASVLTESFDLLVVENIPDARLYYEALEDGLSCLDSAPLEGLEQMTANLISRLLELSGIGRPNSTAGLLSAMNLVEAGAEKGLRSKVALKEILSGGNRPA